MNGEIVPAPHFAIPPVLSEVDLVQAFLSGRKPTTLRAYGRDLVDFATFLGATTPREAMNLLIAAGPGHANAIALAYRTHLGTRGLKSATVNRRLAALRSIVKLARTLGQVTWTLEVPSPKTQAYRDTIACGTPGWRAMLATAKEEAEGGDPKSVRDLAIVRVLHDLGLRRGEAVSTDAGDVDLGRGTLSVIGKGKTEAIKLTLPDPTREALRQWLAIRRGDGPLFHRLDSAAIVPGRLTGEAVRLIVAELAKRAGVSGPVRPHGLRHIAVTEVLDRNGGDIRAAQEFARHSDPKTTMRYDRNRRDLAGSMARLIADE